MTNPEPIKDYFERRAEQERIAAEQASDARAANSHRELADHYQGLAEGAEAPSDEAERDEPCAVSKEFRIVP